jgi:hypothetical protein
LGLNRRARWTLYTTAIGEIRSIRVHCGHIGFPPPCRRIVVGIAGVHGLPVSPRQGPDSRALNPP